MPSDDPSLPADAMFEKALDIAEKHLQKAMTDGGSLGPYVAVAMIEAAVNAAVEETSHEDVVDMLRDLAAQIEADAEHEDDDD
ncbi:MAG: hypothetical protein GC191_21185 [Azospirillum sp.]|nr:hypothetical protein [Azospirillum sp.]